MSERGEDRQLVGERPREVTVERQHLFRRREGVHGKPADHLADRMQSVFERRCDTEVAAAAAQSPEQIRVRLLRDVEHLALRGDELDRQEIVRGEPVNSHEPAESAAEREARDPRCRDRAARHGQTVLSRRCVELIPGHASFGSRGPGVRIHVNGFHLGEIDHETAFGDGAARDVVTPSAHGDLESVLVREHDRPGDVLRGSAARDQCRALVDQAVVDASGLVVVRITRL